MKYCLGDDAQRVIEVKTQSYNHQLAAMTKCYGKEYAALFMEQGTGKSKVAIDIVSNLYLEKKIDAVLLIAPNGVQEQWVSEQVPIHSPVKTEDLLWKTNKSKYFVNKLEVFVTRKYQALKWFYVNVETFSTENNLEIFIKYCLSNRVFIIVDESTRIKNMDANRSYNINYGLSKLTKSGKKITEVEKLSKYRLILTGTMITNSPYDLYSMFDFLSYNFFGVSYFAFKLHYGIEIRDLNEQVGKKFSRKIQESEIMSIRNYARDGMQYEEIASIMGTSYKNVQWLVEHPNHNSCYKNLEELKEKIKPVSFIVKKEDCLDLPPKVYEKIYVEMNKEQKRVYKELEKEYITKYLDTELSVQNKLTLIGRLQQITGGFFPYKEVKEFTYPNGDVKIEELNSILPITKTNPKIEAIKRDLEETNNEQIIIWCRFVAEIKAVSDMLMKSYPGKRIEAYYGGVSKGRRKDIIGDFKNGEVDVLVINPRTGALGLNLQMSYLAYYYSNSYSLEDRAQSEDRQHRSGQTKTCVYKDIIMKGTVDEKVFKALQQKKNLLDYFRQANISEFIMEY